MGCVVSMGLWLRLKWQLRRMRRAITDVITDASQSCVRFSTTEPDLYALCAQFNELTNRLNQSKERARRLEESRSRMLANLTHDFQTPLTAMLGYMEALRDDKELSEQQRENYLGIVIRKGEEVSRMFRDFFELSKLEANDTLIQLQKVNVTELLPEFLVNFYYECEKNEIEMMLDLPSAPVWVWAEPRLLERVVNNLLVNALRYGSEGGVIGVSVCVENTECKVSVWDQGRGIAAEDLPFVFDRLYTGAASRNRKLQGSGLGLAIVKQIVGKQTGRIEVFSKPSCKTEFVFTLKLAAH